MKKKMFTKMLDALLTTLEILLLPVAIIGGIVLLLACTGLVILFPVPILVVVLVAVILSKGGKNND